MSSVIPQGYRAVLLGSSATLEGLSGIYPLEEGAPEGRLMLMELDFAEAPSAEVLADLNSQFSSAGVTPWPGNTQIAFADATQPIMYLCWTKGIAWMSVIIAILVLGLLPALLGAFVWWLLPEEITSLISMMVMVAIVVLMMKVMAPMLKGERAPTLEEGK